MTMASSQPLLPSDKLFTLGPVTYNLVGWNQAVDKVPTDPLNRDYMWRGYSQILAVPGPTSYPRCVQSECGFHPVSWPLRTHGTATIDKL